MFRYARSVAALSAMSSSAPPLRVYLPRDTHTHTHTRVGKLTLTYTSSSRFPLYAHLPSLSRARLPNHLPRSPCLLLSLFKCAMDHYSPMSTSSLDQGQPRPHYRPEAYEGQQSQHDDLMSEQRRQAQPAGQQSHLHEQQRPRQEQQQQQGPDFQQGHRGDHHQQQHPARQTDLRQADDHGASRGPHQHDQQQHYDQHRQQQHLYDQHRQQQQLYDQHQQQQPRYDQHHQQQPRYDQRHQQQLHQSQYPVGQAQADMNYAKVASGHSQHVNQDSAVVLLKDYYHRGEGDGYFFAKEGFVLSDEFPDGILFVLDGKLRQRSSRASQRGHGHGCDQKLRLRAGRIRSGERLLQCNCGNSWECIEQVC